MAETIQSPANARIKNLVRLRQGNHRRRQGMFLIEGAREVARALHAGIQIEEAYLCGTFFPREPRQHSDEEPRQLEEALIAAGAIVFHVFEEPFSKASQREGPDGFLALARSPDFTLDTIELPANPLVLVVEKVEKPGNLGTLVRSADGSGAHAVIVADPVTDLTNPNLIRASQGACFAMPMAAASADDVAAWLANQRLQIGAATPEGVIPYWQADFTRPMAIILGAEATGLSPFWIERADARLVLPMRGLGDSLNVSATGAVLLYEALRQRTA